MRRWFTLIALLLSACTIEEQGRDLRVTPAPIFGYQQWQISEQAALPGGDRVCTASFGEMDVTLRGRGKNATPQVALSYALAPGNRYRVISGSHIYETTEGWFNMADSRAIIGELTGAGPVYTEVMERVIVAGAEWKRRSNKISTENFAPQYQACEKYVQKK